MVFFLFLLGVFQCALVWALGKSARHLEDYAQKEWDQARYNPPGGWPTCALIVPVAGTHPAIQSALVSLAQQNYPRYALCLVTGSHEDPANILVSQIAAEYPHVVHIKAGISLDRGQKNHNLLAGLASGAQQADIYAFADSTHIARPDFLRCLILPILRGDAAFTTGYHEVLPETQKIPVLGYALSVMFMHFMQGVPTLTQPWGGAMAMSRAAFERYNVGALWASNVVDDCSLAGHLAQAGVRARLCAGALLATRVSEEPVSVWQAWMERQILFLKFCMPGQWVLLGFVCLLMTIPAIWCIWACLMGLIGRVGGTAPFLALCWLCCASWLIGSWRRYVPSPPYIGRWIISFFCACFMFLAVYIGTIGKHTLRWHNCTYHVGRGGRVEKIVRH